MSQKLYKVEDIQLLFKELKVEIKKLKCFIEECCSKIPINVGSGATLFKRLYRNNWEFKSILPGSNITITEQDDTITINSTGGGTVSCDDVKECIGVSPSGDPNKFYNEQGDFLTISASGFTCSDLDICTTDSLKEGATNFYYTQARFNSDFATKTTANLTENTNLYFTNSRAISALTGQNISIFTNNLNYVRDIDLAPYLLSSTAAATYQPIGSYLTSAIISLNGLTNSTQTFVNDTNVTLTSTGTTHTLGWTGTLADSRIASAATWNAKENALGFTPEDVANKSDSFTASSSTTYATTKALVDGLATKQNKLVGKFSGASAVTATLPNQDYFMESILIPANTFSNNDILKFSVLAAKNAAGATSRLIRARIDTSSGTITGVLIASYQTASSGNQYLAPLDRRYNVQSSGLNGLLGSVSAITDLSAIAGTSTTGSITGIDWTVDNYLNIVFQSSSASPSILTLYTIELWKI